MIRGYRAVVDPEALGLFVTALIAATPLDPQQPDDLPERVAEFPEVEDCYSVAGEASYILKVRTQDHGRPGGPDPPAPGEGRRRDPHDDRPVDPVRGPAAPRSRSVPGIPRSQGSTFREVSLHNGAMTRPPVAV